IPEAAVLDGGVLAKPVERSIADATGGDVDDAGEAGFVLPVVDEAQIGEDVFDLAPLVETHAADEPVGNAVANEAVLDGAGEGVRAVENGHVAPTHAGRGELTHLGRDPLALFLVAVGLVNDDEVAAGALCPERAWLAVRVAADDGICGGEDG